MMMMRGEMWNQFGSLIASVMFLWAMFQQYFPYELRVRVSKYAQKVLNFVYPYIEITFLEYSGDRFQRSKAYAAIERYLSANSSTRAKRLKGDVVKDSDSLVLSMDDREEITDEFRGIKLWWSSGTKTPNTRSFSFYPQDEVKRSYVLSFHKRHREIITKAYLSHVLDEGKAIAVKNRQRKLYTNSMGEDWSRFSYKRSMWSHVVFEHPATFDTVALEPKKKADIVNDLINFSNSKDYYAKIGKAWKRGYLLYGPPGTGKSTMIAAMANLLQYDVYDLELTAVKDNTELRKLLIDTAGKSIIVIEDIDCSLDLTGQRKNKKEKEDGDETNPILKKAKDEGEAKYSKVTLSGLLNFIDGLWSACGGERIIVFTTNYVEKLDPALIRSGRMDKHIEMSYCCFEAFKVFAMNYLDADSHPLFERIRQLLEDTVMTPADVAENLMPKSAEEDATACFEILIKALEKAKEDARLKAEEEKRLKAEEEEKKTAEKEDKEQSTVQEIKEEQAAANVQGVKENGVMN